MTMLNLTNEPSTDEKNLSKDKASFLALLERLGDVTAASAELGINRGAGYRWARSVGIRGSKPHPGREMFRELRGAGSPRQEAAALAGVDIRTAVDWDKGIRKSNNRRIYPDGRVIEYTGNVNRTPTAKAIKLAALEKQINIRYLSLLERETIRDLHVAGGSLRTIATLMSRSPSTISRELARNRQPEQGEYQPYSAHRMAASRRPRPKDLKLSTEVQLREYVAKKLGVRWSPEQISQALIREYPTTDTMHASPETIYQALYSPARSGLRRDLAAKLRTGRARRKPRRSSEARRSRFVDPMTMICDRPLEVEDRSVPSHWESQCLCQAVLSIGISAGSW
ncbi:IS30 family transposase [Cryobacterium sp. Y50]|uniref:IS30 family transposase n=1 Tax=Cryobacterium sp. Y50 TaxID=2048286 RepID=UPI001304D4F4